MEKKTLAFVGTNRIKIEMGGQERTIVMGMKTMQRVSAALAANTPDVLIQLEGFTTTIVEGMRDKPEDLDANKVIEWVDDMPKSEQDKLKAFVFEQLGFMMNEYLDGIEALNRVLDSRTTKTENSEQTNQTTK